MKGDNAMSGPVQLVFDPVRIAPKVRDGTLHSLGAIEINGCALRNPRNRFLPWFDTYEGEVFSTLRFDRCEERGDCWVVHTTARSDPDYPFRERRDSSGDICLRPEIWDAEPREAAFRMVFAPAEQRFDQWRFTGFTYWFEYESDAIPVHRIMDRQTWEVGGDLADVTLLCRCLFDLPRKRVTRETRFSTVGLEKSAGALPGNLWGRWSLLPPFDMQYGRAGVLLGLFDRVSNIRTVVESAPGEDWIRIVDLHYFANSNTVKTNPKTILHCPDQLDDVDAINLWTRVYDDEKEKACRQFGIEDDGPPRVSWHHEIWHGIDFNSSFEDGIEGAAEIGAEQMCIGAVWESTRSFTDNLLKLTTAEERAGTELEKRSGESSTHKLHVLDYEVAEAYGGESALRALVDRAANKGLDLITWAKFAPGVTGYLTNRKDLGEGLAGIYNAKESGRHPDSGYPFHTCSVNLHAPIKDFIKERLMDRMERNGLKGFLWDSFSNMGWWQVNYSDGTMRPQCEEMGRLYAELSNAGFYLQPEAIVSFSNHNSIGLHGGDIFAGELCAFAYNSAICLHAINHTPQGKEEFRHITRFLHGEMAFDTIFQCYAHKRIPPFRSVCLLEEREKVLPERLEQLKELNLLYRKERDRMVRRTVLKEGRGVLWEDGSEECLWFSFRDQEWAGPVKDALTDEATTSGNVEANRAYIVPLAEARKQLMSGASQAVGA